jgi:hypothetical protein
MKRFITCLLCILLLSGCVSPTPAVETSLPESTSEASKPDLASEAPESSSPAILRQELQNTLPVTPQGRSILANFQKPDYLHHIIFDTAYDETTETYAVLYAISNSEQGELWHDNSDESARLQIQLFDKQGEFLRKIETDIQPRYVSITGDLGSPGRPIFRNGLLAFSAGFLTGYVLLNVLDETYTKLFATDCVADGDYFLFDGIGWFADRNTEEHIYSLYHKDQPIASISLNSDDLFLGLLQNIKEGDENCSFSLDSQSKTALIENEELTLHLDFSTQTWNIKRHYTRADLLYPIATSSDGRWEIHTVPYELISELVAVNMSSGVTTYLSYNLRNAVFLTNNLLLCNGVSRLELIDVEKGQIIDREFAINCEAKDCLINGIAYDANEDMILVAWRSPQQPSNQFKELPLMLDVYRSDGTLVKSIDTGLEIVAFRKHFVIDVALIPNDDGFVDITINDPYSNVITATVKYN